MNSRTLITNNYLTEKRKIPRLFFVFILFFVISMNLPSPAFANENLIDDQAGRIRTGLKIFRSLLLADRDIEEKVNDEQSVDIVFLFQANNGKAKHFAKTFVRMGRRSSVGLIKGNPIRVHVMRKLSLIENTNIQPAAIFIIDPLIESRVKAIAEYGRKNKIITFSPYEGDVENGILGGLAVDSRILPFINTSTLAASEVRIKSFFLKVARTYEPNDIK